MLKATHKNNKTECSLEKRTVGQSLSSRGLVGSVLTRSARRRKLGKLTGENTLTATRRLRSSANRPSAAPSPLAVFEVPLVAGLDEDCPVGAVPAAPDSAASSASRGANESGDRTSRIK